jgi:prepilin-type N-terminal cleavage/methylation domain-containing protein
MSNPLYSGIRRRNMTLLLSWLAPRRSNQGFTLIELTVVLAVIITLALVLTPSIANFINDARVARARADISTLSGAIAQFNKDMGFYPQWHTANAGGPGLAANKVDLLISPGNIPTVGTANTWTTGTTDLFSDQLVTNAPAYTTKTSTSQFGWNGPYITNTINADPWNNRYMANTGLIDTTLGLSDATGAIKSAVWIVSAGANGAIDTPYTQGVTVATPAGDDLVSRLQ